MSKQTTFSFSTKDRCMSANKQLVSFLFPFFAFVDFIAFSAFVAFHEFVSLFSFSCKTTPFPFSICSRGETGSFANVSHQKKDDRYTTQTQTHCFGCCCESNTSCKNGCTYLFVATQKERQGTYSGTYGSL